MKYVVVTGGVVSGLGKGITISSIGVILKSAGLRVTAIKIDPYLNSDAGTMSPFEHGEVFVLNDGGEADLDLGNYERFLDINLTRDHNITTGKVYHQVIKRERRGDYLGKTVQVVPHVTNAIQDWIEKIAAIPVDDTSESADVCLVEVGGTVGDIESMIFLEALRQLQFRVGHENYCHVHVSLVPVLGSVGEQKTKPTQHGVKELRSLGLSPDLIVCRSLADTFKSGQELEKSTKVKIGMFCYIAASHVLSVHDVPNIYHVPLMLQQQFCGDLILKRLSLTPPKDKYELDAWEDLAKRCDSFTESVSIAVVGKYTGLTDSYLSIIKSLKHATIECSKDLDIVWIDASELEPAVKSTDPAAYEAAWTKMKACSGVLVPGGFGDRGVEGMILAAQYARESKTPYFGICLGMQVAVIEYARNVLKLPDVHTEEIKQHCATKAIVFMPEIDPVNLGGTMRLGGRRTLIKPRADGVKTISEYIYKEKKFVLERHRHRYEVNPELVPALQSEGLHFIGMDEHAQRMEIVELDRKVHPFFYATQYHPEFKSRPGKCSPPFLGFILAVIGQLDGLMSA